uniref:NACHT domain-containing protein n=1 Tax=Steinernema glaseri TaxID=37863 RepID=A0A1I7ZXC2_9BILA
MIRVTPNFYRNLSGPMPFPGPHRERSPPLPRRAIAAATMQQQENRRSFNGFGSLRRSLRQINPFRNQLFRLPATPRLSRSRKVTSGVEDATEWNFERPPSCTASTSRQSTVDILPSPQLTSERRAGSLRGTPRALEEPLGRAGGSVRLGRATKQRPPICRQFLDPPPPDPHEAESAIREQMKKLMSPASARRQQFLQLPNTSYAPSGEIYDAYWMEDSLSSPAYSTISLLQGANGSARPMSSASSTLRRQGSIFHRNSFQLNGIHPHDVAVRLKSPNAKTSQLLSKFPVLFEIQDALPDSALESVFLGREWVFKELYQMLLVDQCQFVLVEGGPGTGKTSVLSQILLHSPLLHNSAKSNGNTVDSGIVVSSSQSSLHESPPLSSVNYEWLRGVGAQVVAFHFCRLGSAASCSIPEFICNLAAQLIRVPALLDYVELIGKSTALQSLITLSECSRHDPLLVFRKTIVEPLQQVKVNESCLIVLIDSIDEAEFHRNEDGASIEWLLGQVKDELPTTSQGRTSDFSEVRADLFQSGIRQEPERANSPNRRHNPR